jgi:hypothetical protein
MKIYNIAIVLLTSLILSCTTRVEKKLINEGIVINPLDCTQQIKSFDHLIDTAFTIPLEANEGSFIVDIGKILKTKDKKFIILNTSNILLFDYSGRFLFEIGTMGKGPGEYMKIYDICLSSDEKFIYALDCYNRVYKYSIVDGSFIEKIIPSWAQNKRTCDGICISDNNGFYLFCSNPKDYRDFENDFYCMGKFDSKGKLIEELFLRTDFCLTPQRFTQTYDQCTFIRPLEGERSLFKVKNGKLTSLFQISFGEKEVPLKYIYDLKGRVAQNIPKFIESPFYKLPIGFQDTHDMFYFKSIGPEGITHEFLLNKSNLKGVQWSHADKLHFALNCSDSTYFYGVYNDAEISNKDQLKTRPSNALREYLVKQLNLEPISIDSNPTIIAIKFKSTNNIKTQH